MPGNTNQPNQDLYQNETPGAENPSVGQPATSAKQGRSAAIKKHHYGKHAPPEGLTDRTPRRATRHRSRRSIKRRRSPSSVPRWKSATVDGRNERQGSQ